jgi:glycine/D-amino acid oxidase-like deaminating enzyme
LASRLELRKVVVHLGTAVSGIGMRGGRVSAVTTSAGECPAAAVVVTTDPWQLFAAMLPANAGRRTQRKLRRLRPALAPRISHQVLDRPGTGVTETITLTHDGVPTVEYLRPTVPARLPASFWLDRSRRPGRGRPRSLVRQRLPPTAATTISAEAPHPLSRVVLAELRTIHR